MPHTIRDYADIFSLIAASMIIDAVCHAVRRRHFLVATH